MGNSSSDVIQSRPQALKATGIDSERKLLVCDWSSGIQRSRKPGVPGAAAALGGPDSLRYRRRVMQRKNIVAVLILLIACATVNSETPAGPPATDQNTVKPAETAPEQADLQSIAPEKANRGATVTVTGEFPTEPVTIAVELKRLGDASDAKGITADKVALKENGESFTFVIPRTARLGKYDVLVTFSKAGKKVGPLAVPVSEGDSFAVTSGQPVRINAVYPVVNYPENNTFGFKIIGEGFSPIKEDNALVIEGRGIVPLCSGQTPAANCVNEEIIDPGREIRFSGLARDEFQGVQNVRIRVGDEYSDKAIAVTLAKVGRGIPALVAAGFIGGIIALVVLLLGSKAWRTSDGRRVSKLNAIFLEKDTNTYSLSKLQFYLWTLAALFGYIYLSAARSLVQGKFEFADIPENLPGILLVTVSTSAVAVGITSAKGPKGAGEQGPSLADFITTGGLVAAERIQFLVWTIVGVGAFIFLTLSTEPGRIENLPAVPERFLYLMGISSFGYLGGKLARKPGPVINNIVAEAGSLTLQIQGSNLSPDAAFRIDEADLKPTLLDKELHPDGRPEVVTKDEDAGLAKVLRMTIADPAKEWLEGEHNFTITNPDGQKAVMTFSVADSTETDATEDAAKAAAEATVKAAEGAAAKVAEEAIANQPAAKAAATSEAIAKAAAEAAATEAAAEAAATEAAAKAAEETAASETGANQSDANEP